MKERAGQRGSQGKEEDVICLAAQAAIVVQPLTVQVVATASLTATGVNSRDSVSAGVCGRDVGVARKRESAKGENAWCLGDKDANE